MKTNHRTIFCAAIIIVLFGMMLSLIGCSKKDVQVPSTKQTYYVRIGAVTTDTVYSTIIKVK